jgi:hypothetical protein
MYPNRRADLTVRVVDGQTLVLDRDGGMIHQLNTTASCIWECCDGTRSIDDIAQHLASEYGVSVISVQQGVVDTIAKFQEQGLLTERLAGNTLDNQGTAQIKGAT